MRLFSGNVSRATPFLDAGLRSVRGCICACVAIGAPVVAVSQDVSGIVHIVGANGSSGATVVLLDSAGRVVRGMITRNDGSFTLHAAVPGRYRVRARQIGFSPDSSAQLDLMRGHTTTIDLSLARFATSLSAVHVTEARRCTLAPAAGTLALQLWQDVQSALTAAVITESDHDAQLALLTRFSREIDPDTRRVIRSASWQAIGSSSEPYSALPADSLAARGFVVNEGQDVVYYAPDARTLLSDAFARTHCFSPSEDADHPGLIGLAFTPVNRSARGQVSGALWMDRTTRELRYLEFRYSNPASRTSEAESTDATGRIDYTRLPGGRWIVGHWILHVPVVVMRDARTISGGTSLGIGVGTTLTPTRIPHLQSLWEIGGDARITTDSLSPLRATFSVVQGQVMNGADTMAVHPAVQGLRVQLTAVGDTTHSAQLQQLTDRDGKFSIDSVPAGDYVMRITSPGLDTMAMKFPDRPIHVNRATKLTMTMTLPTMTSIISALCGADYRPGYRILHGTVSDLTTGKPIAGATVKDYWYETVSTGRNFSAHTQNASTRTADDGSYSICAAAPHRTLYVSASLGDRKSLVQRLEPSGQLVRMLDLTMQPRQ